jgi:hypothetical protein
MGALSPSLDSKARTGKRSSMWYDGTKSGEALSINAMATLRLTDILHNVLGDKTTEDRNISTCPSLQSEITNIRQALTELHILFNGLSAQIPTSEDIQKIVDLRLSLTDMGRSGDRIYDRQMSEEKSCSMSKSPEGVRPRFDRQIIHDFSILPLCSEQLDEIRGSDDLELFTTVTNPGGLGLFPIIHTKPAVQKQQRKTTGPMDRVPISEELRQGLESSQTIGQLKEQIKAQEQELKKQKQALQKLTLDEYSLSREDLMAKWAKEDRIRKYGELLYLELTDDEKKMTKAELRRKWTREARATWIERQRQLGKIVKICEVCNSEVVVGDPYHRCFVAFHQTIDRKGGIPRQKEVLVTQSKTGAVNIRHQTAINLDDYRKTLEASQKLFQKLALIKGRIESGSTEATPVPESKVANSKRYGESNEPEISKIQVVEETDDDIDVETVNENFQLLPL